MFQENLPASPRGIQQSHRSRCMHEASVLLFFQHAKCKVPCDSACASGQEFYRSPIEEEYENEERIYLRLQQTKLFRPLKDSAQWRRYGSEWESLSRLML